MIFPSARPAPQSAVTLSGRLCCLLQGNTEEGNIEEGTALKRTILRGLSSHAVCDAPRKAGDLLATRCRRPCERWPRIALRNEINDFACGVTRTRTIQMPEQQQTCERRCALFSPF
jgi:hypothetical protein